MVKMGRTWLTGCSTIAAVLLPLGCSSPSSVFVAMDDGDDALVRVLDHGGDVDAPDPNGYPPVQLAAIRGDARELRVVLDRHAHLDALNRKGETALFLAASLGHLDCVYLLLAAGANPNVHVSWTLSTPLLEAVLRGPTETVGLLLDRGASPDDPNSWGETPLHVAARTDPVRGEFLARMLGEHGADFDRRDLRGYTPLHQAAADGNLGIIKVYAERHHDLSVPGTSGATPLDVAMAGQQVVAADWLYRLGARTATTADFAPPLHRAARLDDFDQTEILLTFGADARSVFDGKTPLEVAQEAGSPRVEPLLAQALALPH